MKTIEKNCLECGKSFIARLVDHKRNRAKYCNLSCANSVKGRNRTYENYRVELSCSKCNKSFTRAKSKLKNSRSGLYFCSRKCKDEAQRINSGFKAVQPAHYQQGNYSYRNRAFREYKHKCKLCGYKKYIEVLQVHHIDNNRKNNKIENLVILCPTCHIEIHYGKTNL